MKKVLSLILTILLLSTFALLFVSCGKKDNGESKATYIARLEALGYEVGEMNSEATGEFQCEWMLKGIKQMDPIEDTLYVYIVKYSNEKQVENADATIKEKTRYAHKKHGTVFIYGILNAVRDAEGIAHD